VTQASDQARLAFALVLALAAAVDVLHINLAQVNSTAAELSDR
jgi:hypothetical protein